MMIQTLLAMVKIIVLYVPKNKEIQDQQQHHHHQHHHQHHHHHHQHQHRYRPDQFTGHILHRHKTASTAYADSRDWLGNVLKPGGQTWGCPDEKLSVRINLMRPAVNLLIGLKIRTCVVGNQLINSLYGIP